MFSFPCRFILHKVDTELFCLVFFSLSIMFMSFIMILLIYFAFILLLKDIFTNSYYKNYKPGFFAEWIVGPLSLLDNKKTFFPKCGPNYTHTHSVAHAAILLSVMKSLSVLFWFVFTFSFIKPIYIFLDTL